MVTSFYAAIFNPSFPIRLIHMVLAAYETAAFAIAGISAFFLLLGRNVLFYRRSLGIALAMAAVLAPLQIYAGDVNGRVVFRHQPAKLAAIEGHWETNTRGGAPLALFGFPDMEKEQTLFEIAIPDSLSLLLTHSRDGRVRGLKDFPPQDRPNSLILFWSFRLMFAVGALYLLLMLWAGYLWRRGKLFENLLFLLCLVLVQPLGFLATQLGWITAEMGRQPWLVYNLMRVSEGLSPIPAGNVAWSLILFLIVFPLIGGSYFFYGLKTLWRGPDLESPIPPIQRPAGMRPLQETGERKEPR
jgi:cytochrome d ubiquinol oxidase subunit I